MLKREIRIFTGHSEKGKNKVNLFMIRMALTFNNDTVIVNYSYTYTDIVIDNSVYVDTRNGTGTNTNIDIDTEH